MAQPAASPFFSILGKAIWSPSLQNRLPDASFLLIEPGGVLDETGRTSPRSLRHLPILDLDGALDLPHLRSAIDQIPKAGPWLSLAAKKALLAKACGMLEKAQATTHKAGASVPNWALGYLAHADMHEALGLDPPLVAKAWRGDTMVAKRASSWVKSYKGAKTRAPKLAAAAETALRKKVAAHNAAHGEPGKRVTLSLAKAVYQRGTAACAASGRPMVKSAGQWGMARTNAFLRLVATGAPHLPEYVADNDLRPARPAPATETPPAAEAAAEPLETQQDDGELAPEDMPRRPFQGIPLVIDRPRGFVQTGTAKDGTPWEREYKTDYGYIPATLGGDDEELDVFVGPNDAAPLAYWVAQTREDGTFDEYKCILPGQELSGTVIGASKALYTGQAVKLRCASGKTLSITPNHPVLTLRGLVPAGRIKEGDQLLAYVGEGDRSTSRDHKNNPPTVVEEVFRALVELHPLGVSRKLVAPLDFHGDGCRFHGDVEVVRTYRQLRNGGVPQAPERVKEGDFPGALLAEVALAGSSPLQPGLEGEDATGVGARGSFAQSALMLRENLGGTAGDTQSYRFGEVSDVDIALLKTASDRANVYTETLGDALRGLSSDVTLDDVVDIEIVHYSGPVFDFQSASGLIVVNRVIVSNCFLGYDSEEAARACYLEHIPARFMGSVFATPVGALQALLGMHPAEMQRETEGTPEAVIEAARAAATGEDVETLLERLRVALAAMDATQKAGADKYDGIDLAPPDGVREALKRGLALHEEGFSGDGLQSETVSWATRMAAGEKVSPDKARKMAAWFARHAVDEKADWATEKTPGYVAWMLWGGDPGRAWAEKLGTQMDARDKGTASKADPDPGGEAAAAQRKAETPEERSARLDDLPVRDRMLRAAKAIGDLGAKCEDTTAHQADRDAAVHSFWPATRELLAALGDGGMGGAPEACAKLGLDTTKPNGGPGEATEKAAPESHTIDIEVGGDGLLVIRNIIGAMKLMGARGSSGGIFYESSGDLHSAGGFDGDGPAKIGRITIDGEEFKPTSDELGDRHPVGTLKPLSDARLAAHPEDAPVAKTLDFCAIGKDAGGAPREERYVLGPALIPDVVDLQGDTYTRETVRETAFRWMRDYQNRSIQHSEDPEKAMGLLEDGLANDKIALVESYVLPVDMTIGDRTMPAGTWMVGAIIVDDTEWANVKAGRKTGWSIGGLARRTPIAPAAT